MLWKHVLFPNSSLHFINFKSLRALSTLSSPSFKLIQETQNHKFHNTREFGEQVSRPNSRVSLSPHTVLSALGNCSSDLVALSFFIWCARQPNYFHDRRSIDHMVNVVSTLAQKFVSTNGIVRELESIGCVTKPQTFLLLLRIFWVGGMYNMVLDVFEEMIRFGYAPNTFACNVVMDVWLRIGLVGIGLSVLRDTSAPNFLSFNIALCNLCKLNDLFNVKMVMRDMLAKGYHPNAETFVMILNCFCKKGRIAEAFQVVGLMISLGIRVSVLVWSILIDGLCRNRRPIMANHLLEKMIDTGCTPNVVVYTSLVKGFMKSQMVDDALRIIDQMESRGCQIDLVLCNVLIDCLAKLGRYDEALGVLFEMRKWNFKPDIYTFSSLISTLSPKVINSFDIPKDLVVHNSLLNYFCKAGFPTDAVKFYDRILSHGFIPDKFTYAGVLTALCGANRFDEAVKVYRGVVMNHFNLDAHVHTVIIGGLVKAGKYHTAIHLFREAVRKAYPLDVVSYTIAIQGLVRSKRVKEAFTLYNQMKELGIAPNRHTCHIMISGFVKDRNLDMLKQILQQMLDAGIDLDFVTCIKIANLIFKAKGYHPVLNLLIEMWDSQLIPIKAMYVLLAKVFTSGVEAVDARHRLLGGYLRNNSFVETSSSDDLSDMVASYDISTLLSSRQSRIPEVFLKKLEPVQSKKIQNFFQLGL
ncbi:hypothetical protein Ancab_029437 [Ancistrocladus abbreviatus]